MKSPFGPGAGGGGGESGMQGEGGLMLNVDAGDMVDPTLGGPCEDDGQCDDRVDCTVDHCDQSLGRCRFQPDDASCDDKVYCNGAERCDIRGGCVAGEVVACSDNSTCTIDTCVEDSQSCAHEPRDEDGDGDPTLNCGGQDCDDSNPLVSSKATEVCGNGRDDDCDGEVDEADCAAPEYDDCKTALTVTQPGYYDVDLTATKLDNPTACATEKDGFRDAVLELVVPDGGPYDLDITAKSDHAKLALGTADSCGDAASASCVRDSATPVGTRVARLLLRGVGAGSYPLYVAADDEITAQVHVERRAAETYPGELCEDAVPLSAGGPPVVLRLPAYQLDARSLCWREVQSPSGDAFVSFSLAEPADVTLVAEAVNDFANPVIALFDSSCASEVTCRDSQPGRLFVRNLPAGSYRVLVAASAPDDVSVRLATSAVSTPPPGEGCGDPLPLETPGAEQVVDLSNHEDALYTGCSVGAPDVAFAFELKEKRDVALVARLSDNDSGSVSLTPMSCDRALVCERGLGLLPAYQHGLQAGSYGAVVESKNGNPIGLSLFERPVVPARLVPFADNCDGLVTIPESGGYFTGNTSNAFADFDAGCDVGGQAAGGAKDQLLKLSLSSPHRVFFDLQSRSFDAQGHNTYRPMLSVRQGQACPGAELPQACSPGYGAFRSFLDLNLQAGVYFVQIDGFDGDDGAWSLEVFTADN